MAAGVDFSSKAGVGALQDIMAGKTKPKDEKQGLMAMSAIMWKKSFELALKSDADEGVDGVTSSERAATKDQQSTFMAIQTAAALSDSIGAQLLHATRRGG